MFVLFVLLLFTKQSQINKDRTPLMASVL